LLEICCDGFQTIANIKGLSSEIQGRSKIAPTERYLQNIEMSHLGVLFKIHRDKKKVIKKLAFLLNLSSAEKSCSDMPVPEFYYLHRDTNKGHGQGQGQGHRQGHRQVQGHGHGHGHGQGSGQGHGQGH
jgi:hypothetical protein